EAMENKIENRVTLFENRTNTSVTACIIMGQRGRIDICMSRNRRNTRKKTRDLAVGKHRFISIIKKQLANL
ncbi:MAG: hypothetical protein WC147_00705, partial [Syntrophomonas sp.]